MTHSGFYQSCPLCSEFFFMMYELLDWIQNKGAPFGKFFYFSMNPFHLSQTQLYLLTPLLLLPLSKN